MSKKISVTPDWPASEFYSIEVIFGFNLLLGSPSFLGVMWPLIFVPVTTAISGPYCSPIRYESSNSSMLSYLKTSFTSSGGKPAPKNGKLRLYEKLSLSALV